MLYFFLIEYCQFTIYSLLEAMSKCVEGVGHVGRSHSPMALRQYIYWMKQCLGSVSHGCMKEICWPPSLQSSSVNGLGGHFSDEGVQCSTCFRRFLRPSSGAQNCTHSIWCMSSLLVATASGSSKQAWQLHAVCTIFSSWWWAEKPPETCTALTAIKNIV
jgi:hypothetical protein